MLKVIESNVDMIPIGEYTDSNFETLLEEYRRKNTPLYPGTTSSKIVDGPYIYLEKDHKLKVEGYKPLGI